MSSDNGIFQYGAQARLGRIHDNIRRKIINLNNQLISIPVECIHITNKKKRNGDEVTHVVQKAEVCHIVFPKMENLPLRSISKKDGTNTYAFSSLIDIFKDENQKQFFIIKSKERLTVGDIIVRCIFPDVPDGVIDVLILEVKNPLGTLGATSIIELEYNCSLVTKDLPEDIQQMIVDWAVRRSKIDY